MVDSQKKLPSLLSKMNDPAYYIVVESNSIDPEFGLMYVLITIAMLLGGLFFVMFVQEDED